MNLRLATGVLGGGLVLLLPSSVWAGHGAHTWPDCRLRPCILDGYPTIALTDDRGSIPFAIGHGGDQMVTPRGPTRVVVRAGRSAFVLVNKYRCDLGDLRLARRLRLGLPGRSSPGLSLALPPYPRLGYCGKGDAGSTVVTSSFEPTLAAALRQH